jgi:hypothetical protein
MKMPLLMWLFACQPQQEGLVQGDITSLRVEPTEITLVTKPTQTQRCLIRSLIEIEAPDNKLVNTFIPHYF